MPNLETLPMRIISWLPSTCSTSLRSFSVSVRYGRSHVNCRSRVDTIAISFASTWSTPSAGTSGGGSGGRGRLPAGVAMPAAPMSSGI